MKELAATKTKTLARRIVEECAYGTLFYHKGRVYFYSRGLDGPIVTNSDGCWKFVCELDWKRVLMTRPREKKVRRYKQGNAR